MPQKIEEKTWNSKFEQEILTRWEKCKIYNFTADRRKHVFVIDTPPPYPSGRPWHIGAAAHYAQIDMIARTSRLLGNNVLFPIGIDRNGLPVEIYTEKKHKIRMRMDRENSWICVRLYLTIWKRNDRHHESPGIEWRLRKVL
jgi:valyl-tRNA synthetase